MGQERGCGRLSALFHNGTFRTHGSFPRHIDVMPGTILHILAPFAILLEVFVPAARPVPEGRTVPEAAPHGAGEEFRAAGIPEGPSAFSDDLRGAGLMPVEWLDIPAAEQVRIDQRVTIRISPRAPRRDPFFDRPLGNELPKMRDRKVTRCVPVQSISGVQVQDNRLILHMRDRRIIGASLQKSCRARDFYSGFYVERTRDGRICAGRDEVHSRAGATCAISRLRELVPDD